MWRHLECCEVSLMYNFLILMLSSPIMYIKAGVKCILTYMRINIRLLSQDTFVLNDDFSCYISHEAPLTSRGTVKGAEVIS